MVGVLRLARASQARLGLAQDDIFFYFSVSSYDIFFIFTVARRLRGDNTVRERTSL